MKQALLLIAACSASLYAAPEIPTTSSETSVSSATAASTTTATTTIAAPVRTVPKLEVLFGIDVLESQDFAPLKGKQVGLITNQTGVNRRGRSTADLLHRAQGVKLIALFSPEHGIRGNKEHGQTVGHTIDPRTRLPVYSLYGVNQKPTNPMLNAIDAMVFDMQDVGARFYTYLTTMGLCMEAAAQRKIPFYVLDRPNPAGGDVVEGQVLDWRIRHFTAYFSVPVRHGFTAGELAKWYAKTANLDLDLTIIPAKGWSRPTLWDDTNLEFVPPSPNIRTPEAALVYSGIGMFEATNVAVGRGTETPFLLIGAPWMKGPEVANRLNHLRLPGVTFSSATFKPSKDLYANKLCKGVRIHVTDPHAVRPVDWFVHASIILRDLSRKDYHLRWDEIARVTGSRDFESLYKSGRSAKDILDVFHKSAEKFKEERKPYLLYGDLP